MMYKARGTECGQALLQKSWVVYAKRLAGPVTLGDTRRHARSKRCLKFKGKQNYSQVAGVFSVWRNILCLTGYLNFSGCGQ